MNRPTYVGKIPSDALMSIAHSALMESHNISKKPSHNVTDGATSLRRPMAHKRMAPVLAMPMNLVSVAPDEIAKTLSKGNSSTYSEYGTTSGRVSEKYANSGESATTPAATGPSFEPSKTRITQAIAMSAIVTTGSQNLPIIHILACPFDGREEAFKPHGPGLATRSLT